MARGSSKNVQPDSISRVRTASKSSRDFVREQVAPEIIFAVVGPVGSGTSEICKVLKELLENNNFRTSVLKAREVIQQWAEKKEIDTTSSSRMDATEALQDAGDRMRQETQDNAAVALQLIRRIRRERAEQTGETAAEGEPVVPDDAKRAFILDSLRNPAEVALLRSVYQNAFCLIGVVCQEEVRAARLTTKFSDAGQNRIETFKKRDESATEKHGQQVADTFHLADFFVENSESRFIDGPSAIKKPNPKWIVTDELGRLVDILTRAKIVRPRPSETAMHHAYGARMRSACLSRQVGAALMDRQGNIVSTGTNEVPRAGGGVYGSSFEDNSDQESLSSKDHRCAFHGEYCRNTVEQNSIIDELLSEVPAFESISPTAALKASIRKTRIGQIMEFSRAVHAEMDALLSAARQGISTRGTRLFVTTFPCHNCARHIVAAGVDEVQFIEPFAKSKALPLHGDAITTSADGWKAPSSLTAADLSQMETAPQVLFRPFGGVAPRLYRRAFYKDAELKNNLDGKLLTSFPPPDGMGVSEPLRISYADMEAILAKRAEEVVA